MNSLCSVADHYPPHHFRAEPLHCPVAVSGKLWGKIRTLSTSLAQCQALQLFMQLST